MARLSSERLRLHISNIIQWDSDGIEGIYETIDIKLTINGREAIYGVNGSYELCGNIEYLIDCLTQVLDGKTDYIECEFTEPDFRFEIKKVKDWKHPFTKEMVTDDYEIICWVNSGQWNGIYSATEIGCKFYVKEKDVIGFRDGLQRDFDNRKISQYYGRQAYEMIKNGELTWEDLKNGKQRN